VLLLPGPKKGGFNYADIKKYFTETIAIPTQVVCVKTIQAGKNLRSIC